MDLFRKNKNKCDQCDEKFSSYDELISHARHIHHHAIVTCTGCGKEFIHEKDRLHHAREEHEEKMKKRSHKESYRNTFIKPKDEVEERTKHFSDKL
jgi:hypothetical protein